jgi:dTMP kinase
VTREPGGSPIAEKIRKILLNPDHAGMTPVSELFLYEAARAQHVKQVIEPLLKKGIVVLCDRFNDATVAYQGFGRGIDLELVETLNLASSQGLKPDITFLLDCPSDLGLKRAIRRNQLQSKGKEDRFERERIQFHRHVRAGYLSIAEKEPGRVKVIDGCQGEEEVFEKIRKIVDEVIIAKGIAHSA